MFYLNILVLKSIWPKRHLGGFCYFSEVYLVGHVKFLTKSFKMKNIDLVLFVCIHAKKSLKIFTLVQKCSFSQKKTPSL